MPAFFTLGPPISPASSQRLKSPVSRFSTFVIDAPRSARKSAENGPWISCAISIIFITSSGLLICFDTPGACGASGEVRGLSFAGRRTSSCLKYLLLFGSALLLPLSSIGMERSIYEFPDIFRRVHMEKPGDIEREGVEVAGIDRSPTMIAAGRAESGQGGTIRFYRRNIEKFRLPEQPFDVAF